MEHKEYGEGFVDGFNAALKSDYIKELYQTQDKEMLEKRINELQTQLNQTRLLACQSLPCSQYPQYSQICSINNYYQEGLENTLNAYRRY